jgi:hypothetical protein
MASDRPITAARPGEVRSSREAERHPEERRAKPAETS